MNANEIVRALKILANSCRGQACWNCPAREFGDKANRLCLDGTVLATIDAIESLQAQLAESQRREQATAAMVGKWPVTINSTFCGARIIGADYEARWIRLEWGAPQEPGEEVGR